MDSKEDTARQMSQTQHTNKNENDTACANVTEHPTEKSQGNTTETKQFIEDSWSTEKLCREVDSSSEQNNDQGKQPAFPETQTETAQSEESSSEEQPAPEAPQSCQEMHGGFSAGQQEPAQACLPSAQPPHTDFSISVEAVQGPLPACQQARETDHQLPDHRGSTAETQSQEAEEGEAKGKASERGAAPGAGGGWQEERVGRMVLFGVPIVSLHVEGQERLCLAQISASLLRDFTYNEIHNRRVALGISCLQCTPSQLEVLRRAGAMPVTSRRCGLITKREAERLVRSFISDVPPPRLPDNFTFRVRHQCGWGNEGVFVPARYNSSRAKCIRCSVCDTYFSPNKFIFHCHPSPSSTYRHPAAANFNSWRRHLELVHGGNDDRLLHAWEDVKAMFNGGCRKRISVSSSTSSTSSSPSSSAASSLSSFGGRNASCLAPSWFVGSAYGNVSSHKQSRDGCGSQSHSNHHTSNEAQNLRKLTTVPRLDADPQQKTSFPVGAGVLSLMPPASVSANPHPAFFTSGVPGHVMSYGDYLRSMSRPYSMSSGLPVAGNHFVPDLYRAQPQPPSILPGMFGASPYPLSYFGYPSYFPATAVPDSKGGNPALGFQTQLPAFRGLSTRIESERENYLEKENSNNEEEEEEEEEENIPRPKMHTTEDTEDEISVDERENRDEPDEVTDGSRTEEDVRPNPVQQNVSGESEVRTEAGLVGLFGEKDGKEDVKVDEPRVVENDSNVDNEDEKEDGHEERRDEKGLDAGGHVPQHEEEARNALLLPRDTKSLLKMVEATEDVDAFIHLPIGLLRRLYKASKAKTQAADRELRKLKELQRLQRLKAGELREELSRQFFAIKENIWTEIEQERKMRTVLQEKLAEAQKFTPQTPNSSFSMFPSMK